MGIWRKNYHRRMILRKIFLVCSLAGGVSLLGACSVTLGSESTLPPTYVEIPYSDLALGELDPEILSDPGIPGCKLSDLSPFLWKEVNTGIIDIRTPEEYAFSVGSLYQEGFRANQYDRLENPDTYQSMPEMSYEEFLVTCNVFPEVDFSKHKVASIFRLVSIQSFESYIYECGWHHEGVCLGTNLEVSINF